MKLGNHTFLAFITVFMKTTNHTSFKDFLKNRNDVLEAHKISGEGCYLLKASAKTEEQLNDLLDNILYFGNYRLNLSINVIKNGIL